MPRPGRVVGEHVAVLYFRAAAEHVARLLREARRPRECRSCSWPAPVPAARHAPAARRRPARARPCARRRTRRAPATLRAGVRPPICEMWMRMKSISRSEIERQVLVRSVEQLAHRNRRARLLPQQAEVAVVFGRERVFEEEQAVRLQRLAERDRLDQRHALVDVVQQLDLVAELRAQMLEQLRQHPDVRRRLPDRTRGWSGPMASRGRAGSGTRSRARRRSPGPGRRPGRGRGGTRLPCPCARCPRPPGSRARWRGSSSRRRAALAAEQLVERHVGALALDVPERDVHAAHRVEQHAAVAPVRADVGRLPDVFDLVDVASDEKRLEVLVDGGLDDQGALGEGGAALAVRGPVRSSRP